MKKATESTNEAVMHAAAAGSEFPAAARFPAAITAEVPFEKRLGVYQARMGTLPVIVAIARKHLVQFDTMAGTRPPL